VFVAHTNENAILTLHTNRCGISAQLDAWTRKFPHAYSMLHVQSCTCTVYVHSRTAVAWLKRAYIRNTLDAMRAQHSLHTRFLHECTLCTLLVQMRM